MLNRDLVDQFQRIAAGQQTGTLSVHFAANRLRFRFEEGELQLLDLGENKEHLMARKFLDYHMIGPEILPRLQDVLVAYNVRPPQPSFRADRLSGGNQQKMILAQACERGARLILLAYPTHGLDVQASLNVRELLLAYARRGGSVVIASSELDELLSVCHRIAVLNRGRVAGIQERRVFDHEQLAAWFTSTDFGHGGTA